MEEPLRVLVRVDTRDAAASVEVRGSLTGANCETLLRILRHTATLGASICVNLSRAVRVESGALAVLDAAARDIDGPVEITRRPAGAEDRAPRPLDGGGQTGSPLDNDLALEMILARDQGVLAPPRRAPDTARRPPSGVAGRTPGS